MGGTFWELLAVASLVFVVQAVGICVQHAVMAVRRRGRH